MPVRLANEVDGWYSAGPVSQFGAQTTVIWIGSQKLAISYIDGNWICYSAVCPHRGGPLERGEIIDGIVTCPLHGWAFRLTTNGEEVHGHAGINVHDTRLIDGMLQIRLRDARGGQQ